MVSRRFYRCSQDPYVRANYFLIHYGPIEAMFYALGRGKLLNERVLDVRVSFDSALATISESSHRATCVLDSIVKRSAAFPLSYSNSSTPLLPYAVSFRQVAMGAGRLSTRLPLLYEDRGREVRWDPTRKGEPSRSAITTIFNDHQRMRTTGPFFRSS